MKNFWLFLSNILSDLSNPQLTARERLAVITDIVTILGVVLFNIIPLIIVAKLFDIKFAQLSCIITKITLVVFKFTIPLIALFLMLWGFNKFIDWFSGKFDGGISWLPIVFKIILVLPTFLLLLIGCLNLLSEIQEVLNHLGGKC